MATSKRLSAHREAVRVGAESEPDDDKTLTPDEPGEEDRETPPTKPSTREKSMTDEEMKAAIEAARTEGRESGLKSANDRYKKVFASEHYAGREAAAAKMIDKPSLSAEDIIDLLADMPKAEPKGSTATLTEEQQRAAEEAGRKEMKAALEENKNSDVDASTDAIKPDKRKAADDVWAKAYGLTEGAK